MLTNSPSTNPRLGREQLANKLARKSCTIKFSRPEPDLVITKTVIGGRLPYHCQSVWHGRRQLTFTPATYWLAYDLYSVEGLKKK